MRRLSREIQEEIDAIRIDRAEEPEEKLSFYIIPPTCPIISNLLDQFCRELEANYDIKGRERANIRAATVRLERKIHEQATHPLRKALIYVCKEALSEGKNKCVELMARK